MLGGIVLKTSSWKECSKWAKSRVGGVVISVGRSLSWHRAVLMSHVDARRSSVMFVAVFGIPRLDALMCVEGKRSWKDAEWKRNHELTASAVAAKGHISPEPLSPVEPAPLSKMPSLNDPKSEGKFPKLGDEDVVGPMVQIASPLMLKTPSRKRAFFKFLSDLLPGSLLGRSSAGVRGH